MKITPLAAESMGTRSMATFVELGKTQILIDPGSSLAGSRFDLPPHPLERYQHQKHRDRIQLYCQSAHVIVISHFDGDHFTADQPESYRDKVMFIKNPNRDLSPEQRKRAFSFLKSIQGIARDVVYMDGRTFDLGTVRLAFSAPLPHRPGENGGSVIAVSIREGEQGFGFSSDTGGLSPSRLLDFFRAQKPGTIYLDGPPVYLKEQRMVEASIRETAEALETLIEKIHFTDLILDHGLLREEAWQEPMRPVLDVVRKAGVTLQTAAEYRGDENNLLEARRKKLYEEHPPD
ncbi:hypothetical protein JW906_13575 [bacterium]|nr:hypothetical protein [bacterium]